MAFSLHGANTFSVSAGGSPQTLTLGSSYSTQAGDCLVVVLLDNQSVQTLTVTGCGATWVQAANLVVNNAGLYLWIGYNCTAGGTTITVTGGSSWNGGAAFGAFQGVLSTGNPIRGSVASGSANTGLTATTSSLGYVNGDLLIGAGTTVTADTWTTPSVWSNGGTDNTIQTHTTPGGVIATYQVSASGSATTYKVTATPNSTQIQCAALALEPAVAVGNTGLNSGGLGSGGLGTGGLH